MLKHKSTRLAVILAFCFAELTLGVLVQVTVGNTLIWVSYATVLLACAFVALCFEPTPRWALTQAALLCTVCADYFLVLRGAEQQFLAMLFFSITQLAYAARLFVEDKKPTRRIVHLAARVGFSLLIIAVTLAVLGGGADRVALISMFYFANLTLNVVFAFLQGKKMRLFAIGLALFLCCDVFIGLSLIEGWLPLTKGGILYALAHPGFNAAWVFYVPSQALLSLSLLPWCEKEKSED